MPIEFKRPTLKQMRGSGRYEPRKRGDYAVYWGRTFVGIIQRHTDGKWTTFSNLYWSDPGYRLSRYPELEPFGTSRTARTRKWVAENLVAWYLTLRAFAKHKVTPLGYPNTIKKAQQIERGLRTATRTTAMYAAGHKVRGVRKKVTFS